MELEILGNLEVLEVLSDRGVWVVLEAESLESLEVLVELEILGNLEVLEAHSDRGGRVVLEAAMA